MTLNSRASSRRIRYQECFGRACLLWARQNLIQLFGSAPQIDALLNNEPEWRGLDLKTAAI
jgi:hypothetical protein